jgi:formyl-CoA transferase
VSDVPTQAMSGIRVLDVGHIVAGPMTASLLGDFGADVIKIERPGTGDPLRWNYKKDGVGLFYKVQARNKRCITLDLKSERGREIFHELVRSADVLIENFRPGVMERLGNDWETLHGLNERLVYCRMSGWGQTGPYAERRAYGRVGEAFSGFAHLTGDADGPPMHSAMSLGDSAAAVWGSWAVMVALYWRDAQGGGVGQVIDVALYEPLYRQIEQQIIVQDQLGYSLSRVGNANPGSPVVGSYGTKDGRYFSFSANTTDSINDVLAALEIEDDPRFNSFDACLANSESFQALATEWMAARTLAEVEAAFIEAEASGAAVMSAADLMEHPHILARDMVITLEDEDLGELRMQGVVPKLSVTPGQVRHAGQRLGQANAEVYGELLGMTPEELDELAAKGVI